MPLKVVPITKSDFLVKIPEISEAYWTNFSGVSGSAQSTDYSDGLRRELHKIVGPRQIADVTLSKPYNPVNDLPIIQWWQAWCNASGKENTVMIQPVNYCPDPEPYGSAVTLLGCKPSSVNFAAVDKTSAEISTIELGLSVDSFSIDGGVAQNGNIVSALESVFSRL